MKPQISTSHTITLGRRRVAYTVRISRTAKRRRIAVNGRGVEVILPSPAEEKQAADFLRRNQSWVLEQLAFMERMGSVRQPSPALKNGSILLRGTLAPIQIIQEESNRNFGFVEEQNGCVYIRLPKGKGINPRKALEAWLRRQARQAILDRLKERERELRRKPNRIYIRGQRTKWGGCSRRRNLSFNWRLIMAPPAVLDYIVVHELAHLIEPSHATKFWLIVRSHCPDFERHKAWLHDYADVLKAQLSDI